MSKGLSLLLLHVFMAWSGKTSPCYLWRGYGRLMTQTWRRTSEPTRTKPHYHPLLPHCRTSEHRLQTYWLNLLHRAQSFLRSQQVVSYMYTDFHVKYPLFLWEHKTNFNVLYDFVKNTQMLNLMKNRRMRSAFFHAGGGTDRHNEANPSFSTMLRPRLKN
jgi:hypothetical protein